MRRIKAALEQDNSKKEKTFLYKEEDDIDFNSKPKMLKVITAMLWEIKEMKDDFGLETDTEQVSRRMAASLSEIWVLLEDLKASKLKVYGCVSEDEKALIEPRVLKLLKELNEIESIFNSSRKRK